MRPSLSAAVLLAVAACATPEEQCISRATKDLRVISALIAETETNIARGYAVEQVPSERLIMHLCREDGGSEICWIPETRVRTRPVAIDTEAERRKLAELRAKRDELEAKARAEIEACRTSAGG